MLVAPRKDGPGMHRRAVSIANAVFYHDRAFGSVVAPPSCGDRGRRTCSLMEAGLGQDWVDLEKAAA